MKQHSIDNTTFKTAVVIDLDTTSISLHYKEITKDNYYTFLLCNRGKCKIYSYIRDFEIKENELITILPDIYTKISDVSSDCELMLLSFQSNFLISKTIFEFVMKYIPYIFQDPLIELNIEKKEFIKDSFYLISKSIKIKEFEPSVDYYISLLMMMISGLGMLYVLNGNDKYVENNKHDILKRFIYLAIQYYSKERSLNFYADKMNLTPQHLSTTIKKCTGKTVTDFLASIIIADANTKLKSTELSIQEIAFSLNFPDISTFGKYFKRYTGVSPKKYREN